MKEIRFPKFWDEKEVLKAFQTMATEELYEFFGVKNATAYSRLLAPCFPYKECSNSYSKYVRDLLAAQPVKPEKEYYPFEMWYSDECRVYLKSLHPRAREGVRSRRYQSFALGNTFSAEEKTLNVRLNKVAKSPAPDTETMFIFDSLTKHQKDECKFLKREYTRRKFIDEEKVISDKDLSKYYHSDENNF